MLEKLKKLLTPGNIITVLSIVLNLLGGTGTIKPPVNLGIGASAPAAAAAK